MQLVVNFVDPMHGWAIAGPSSWFLKTAKGLPSLPGIVLPVYRTDDGGVTWSQIRTSQTIESNDGRVSDLYFVDQRDGFLERDGSVPFRTTDGGQTWAKIGPMPPQ